MVLLSFFQSKGVTSIYVLGFNYHVVGFSHQFFALMYGFSRIERVLTLAFKVFFAHLGKLEVYKNTVLAARYAPGLKILSCKVYLIAHGCKYTLKLKLFN